MSNRRRQKPKSRLEQAHTRLFPEDIEKLKRRAEIKGSRWQFELRMLVHKALLEDELKIVEVPTP